MPLLVYIPGVCHTLYTLIINFGICQKPGKSFPGMNLECIHIFTVLCFWVIYSRCGARREICGYFMVQIWSTGCTKSETYRSNAHSTRISTGPDEVPYRIEPTRTVLGRHTIGFQIGPRQSAVEITWRRARRRRPEWSCFARAGDPHPAKCTKRES